MYNVILQIWWRANYRYTFIILILDYWYSHLSRTCTTVLSERVLDSTQSASFNLRTWIIKHCQFTILWESLRYLISVISVIVGRKCSLTSLSFLPILVQRLKKIRIGKCFCEFQLVYNVYLPHDITWLENIVYVTFENFTKTYLHLYISMDRGKKETHRARSNVNIVSWSKLHVAACISGKPELMNIPPLASLPCRQRFNVR